jgi:predicted component of viral defense system (DUF524 family)
MYRITVFYKYNGTFYTRGRGGSIMNIRTIAREVKSNQNKFGSYQDIVESILTSYLKEYDKYHIIVDGEIVDITDVIKPI